MKVALATRSLLFIKQTTFLLGFSFCVKFIPHRHRSDKPFVPVHSWRLQNSEKGFCRAISILKKLGVHKNDTEPDFHIRNFRKAVDTEMVGLLGSKPRRAFYPEK